MESQRLTDADFEPIAPAAGTEPSPASDLDGGYPPWETPGDASLTPEPEQAPEAAVSAQPITDDPTPEDAPAAEPVDVAATDEPVETADDAAESERVARLERELAERDARLAEIEAQQRVQARQQLDAAAIWEEDQLEAQLAQSWAQQVVPQAQRLQGAAQASFLNAQRARFDQARDQGRANIATIHRQELQTILANDPQVRQDFYSQLIQEHGLPEEARSRLAEVPPEAVDSLIPRLRAEYAQMSAKDREIDQLRRELEVQKRAATGADAMGGTQSSGGTADPRLDYSSPTYDPALAYDGAGQWVRSRF